MSSSRSNSNSRRQHSRDGEDSGARPPRLPSLRALAAQRERDNTSPLGLGRSTRLWTTAAGRRADRIRSLDDNASLSEFHRVLDQAWGDQTFGSGDRSRSNDSRGSNLEDLDRHLHEANSHLRMLLEMTSQASLTNNNLAPPTRPPTPPHRPRDLPDDSRRNKRRKLDSERLVQKAPAFRYGKYGQVEPGELRMRMMSCDGGTFSAEMNLVAENILKNDSSVYCTKGNRCNIVLHHQGQTPFTLQELVIRGPTSMNYSHPVREGMVFVTMHQDSILNRTAQYQIQYAPSHVNSGSQDRAESERESSRTNVTIRHHEDGAISYIYPTTTRPAEVGYRIAQMPPEFSSNLPNVGVYTECSDDGEGRRAPNRIGSLPFENVDSDYDGADTPHPGRPSRGDDLFGANSPEYGDMSLAEASEAHANAMQEAVRAVGGKLLAPHARFLIEKKKSTCTIRFDPPISGRFILLKMWNSHPDATSNIDIQSVIAKGFAGPRFFPSVELR